MNHEPMLGRFGVMLPLFIMNRAGPWLGLSVCSERRTQTSSMHCENSGSSSLTWTPLRPQRRNLNGTGMRPPVWFSVRRLTASGRWPANWLMAGLGSSRSGPNGPPFMNSWMTRFARGLKCGPMTDGSAAAAFGASRAARPSAPRPPPRA